MRHNHIVTIRHTRLLHVDILKKLYSNVAVVIENQSDSIRKVHLVDQLGISRTYAITQFLELNWTSEITQVASEIKQGKPIGETFRNHDYNIYKRPVCTHTVRLSDRLKKRFSTTTNQGILHQYVFAVSKDESPVIDFATITEIYPPELSDILTQKRIVHTTAHVALQCTHDTDEHILF
jgi:flavodoxin